MGNMPRTGTDYQSQDSREKVRRFLRTAKALKARTDQIKAGDRGERHRFELVPQLSQMEIDEALEAELMGVESDLKEKLTPEQLERLSGLRDMVKRIKEDARKSE